MQWNLYGNVLVGRGEDDVIDIHVSNPIARKKSAESVRDKARDPKLRNTDLLVLQ